MNTRIMSRAVIRFMLGVSTSIFILTPCVTARAAMVDKVLVVVNDEVVTQREFNRIFDSIEQNYRSRYKGEELKKNLDQARRDLTERLIDAKLAISLAKKQKIEIDGAELNQKIDTIKSHYESEEAFLQELSAKGTNLTEFEREIREQMLAQKLVEQEISNKIVITPGEINDLYEKNREKFVAPRRIKTRSFMLRKKEGDDNAETRKKIEGIRKKLFSGADFAALASKESEGPYAANGGDMGHVAEGQMMEELDKAIFSLKKGELSNVVESSVGYHVFLAEDINDSRTLGLSEVSDFLRQQLFMKKFQEELYKWFQQKRKNAYISYK